MHLYRELKQPKYNYTFGLTPLEKLFWLCHSATTCPTTLRDRKNPHEAKRMGQVKVGWSKIIIPISHTSAKIVGPR